MRALLVVMLLASVARADGELCRPGARYTGKPLSLDVHDADLQEVFRLIADTANVNLVIPDDVRGRVTVKLSRVPWDQAACVIAQTHKLAITVDNGILIIKAR